MQLVFNWAFLRLCLQSSHSFPALSAFPQGKCSHAEVIVTTAVMTFHRDIVLGSS
jgi:hypothetical protein